MGWKPLANIRSLMILRAVKISTIDAPWHSLRYSEVTGCGEVAHYYDGPAEESCEEGSLLSCLQGSYMAFHLYDWERNN